MPHLSLPKQFMGLLILLALAATAVALLSYASLTQTVQASSRLTGEAMAKLQQGNSILERFNEMQGELQRLLRLKDPDEMEKSVQTLDSKQKEMASLVTAVGKESAVVKTAYDRLLGVEKEVKDLYLQGEASQAIEKYFAALIPQHDLFLGEVRKHTQTVAGATRDEATRQAAELKRKMGFRLAAAGVFVLGLAILAWRLERRLARELGLITHRLADASTQVADSSSQVSAASTTLASGASEQAASLQETSASLEEMAGMTRNNAEHAGQTKALAKETRQAAEAGAADMREMNQSMADIQEASQGIAKIIKTIDEIAFQTNILALNAAVEAARAGESGLGFSVVADEVRNLAQRSAQAAKETAEQIENAIAKSQRGVEISAKIQKHLEDITGRVRQMDETIAQIATATSEQSQGIEQVNTAVSQMDKATQSNAASAEESASAAEELSAQARLLREVVQELQRLMGKGAAAASASEQPPLAESHTDAAVSTQSTRMGPRPPGSRLGKSPEACRNVDRKAF